MADDNDEDGDDDEDKDAVLSPVGQETSATRRRGRRQQRR
jgi:hypothetical protein